MPVANICCPTKSQIKSHTIKYQIVAGKPDQLCRKGVDKRQRQPQAGVDWGRIWFSAPDGFAFLYFRKRTNGRDKSLLPFVIFWSWDPQMCVVGHPFIIQQFLSHFFERCWYRSQRVKTAATPAYINLVDHLKKSFDQSACLQL